MIGAFLISYFDIYYTDNVASLSVFLKDNSVEGADIYAVMYEIDPVSNDRIYLFQSDDYTLTSNDIGGWATISFTTPETLVPGTVRYTIPTTAKTVDYNTFRLVKDSDLGSSGGRLYIIQYNDYINSYITQEDEITTTTLDGALTDSATTVTVASTTGFDSLGTIFIENEQITYTGTTSTTFTGATRGANDTTASAHDSATQVA